MFSIIVIKVKTNIMISKSSKGKFISNEVTATIVRPINYFCM